MDKRVLLALALLAIVALPIVHQKPTLETRSPPYEVKYHSYAELVSLAKQLNESSPYVDMFQIGTSYNGSPIYVLRIAQDPTVHKPAILRVFNQHAREYITAETGLFLAYYLSAVLMGNVHDDNSSRLLDRFDIYLVLCANPDGHDIAMFHNERQRKNVHPIDDDGDGLVDEDPPEDINGDGYIDLYYSSTGQYLGAEGIDNDHDGKSGEDRIGGVDPNRNRPRERGEPASNASETFPGFKPLSEPETRAIYHFMMSLGPVALFDIHSGIKALLYPPGTEYGKTQLQDIFSKMSLVALKYSRSAMPSISLYPAYGTLDDTGYYLGHAVSVTLEIFGNSSRPRYVQTSNGYAAYGVKWMFNPMPSKLLDTMREAAAVILGCSYVIYEYADSYTPADEGYILNNGTLTAYVKPNASIVREAFAILVGNNMTRYRTLTDNLKGEFIGSIKVTDLRNGTYALVIFYHGVLIRHYRAFIVTVDEFNDANHDGIDDDREAMWNVTSPTADDDHDGLTNMQEYLLGTNPRSNDTDGDGIIDSIEYNTAWLAMFRGSGLTNISYNFTQPQAYFGTNDGAIFVSVIGSNRSIDISTDGVYFATNDVGVAFFENATSITIVAHYNGESKIFHRAVSNPPGSASSTNETLIISLAVVALIAVIVVVLRLLLRRRKA